VTVDGRFDAGYFVTVRLGRSDFRGMLYYPPPEHTLYHRHDVPLKGEAANKRVEVGRKVA
jgi:hypothetical protein